MGLLDYYQMSRLLAAEERGRGKLGIIDELACGWLADELCGMLLVSLSDT